MAKKQQQPTVSAAKDDQPLTPAVEDLQPPPSKHQEEEEDKFEEHDDDEDSSSSETTTSSEEEEDDDDEEASSSQPVPTITPTKKDEEDIQETDDEDEEEEETDEEDEPPLKLKPQPKPSVAPAKSGTKRTADDNDIKKSKKHKTTASTVVDGKKKMFERIFTHNDEITILQDYAKFIVETKQDPAKHLTVFLSRVKKSISFSVKRNQLKEKVRGLKKKFHNQDMSLKNGKSLTFSKPIEKKIFKLSKNIWGIGGKIDMVEAEECEKENNGLNFILNETVNFDKSVGGVIELSPDEMKRGLKLLNESKRAMFERRWKEIEVAESKVLAMRAKLDATKTSSSSH